MNRLSRIIVVGAAIIISAEAVLTVKARTLTNPGVPAPQTEAHSSATHQDDVLVIDVPGIEVKKVYRPAEVRIGDDHWVTGIVVDGQPRAYLETGMDEPETHIAYDNIDGVNIAVAYCNRTGDARVFCGDAATMRSIRVGGWANDNMQLLIGDQRFAVDSKKIRLKELPFETVKWSVWKARHPNTAIYLGSFRPRTR